MSEARKKLREETDKWLKKGGVNLDEYPEHIRYAALDNVAERRKLDEINKKEKEIKEKISEKEKERETLVIHAEERLRDIKKILHHQLEEEKDGEVIYEQLLVKLRQLPLFSKKLDPILTVAQQEIEEILRDEREHSAKLGRLVAILTGKDIPANYPIPRRRL